MDKIEFNVALAVGINMVFMYQAMEGNEWFNAMLFGIFALVVLLAYRWRINELNDKEQ